MNGDDPLRPVLTRATVAFVEIVGFTQLAAAQGVEQAYFAVTGCLQLLEAIARQYGGAVDRYLGDALMVVYGHPVPRPHAERDAVRAAREMVRQVEETNRSLPFGIPLGVVIGINTGSMVAGDVRGAVVREFHVLGDAVNVAARLKARAPLGGVLVGAETRAAADEEFAFRALGALPLKGKRAAVEVFELAGTRAPRWRRGLASGAGATACFGRDAELAALRAARAALAAGRGGVVAVWGESGAGRSRLLAEGLAPEAAEPSSAAIPCVALDARGEPGDAATPLLAELAPALGASAAAGDVAGALAALEARLREGPLIVAVEDVERLDAASADALPYLFRLAASQPLLLALTGPPTPPPALAPALAALEGAGAAPFLPLRLGPLAPDAARRLLAAASLAEPLDPAAVELVLARGAGNPARLLLAAHLAPALLAGAARGAAGRDNEPGEEAERRRATIVFADITGFTSMTEQLGAERAYPIVVRCLQLLDQVARKHGGSVEKYLGDCVMALFGVPTALEDAPRAAVNAAIEMRRRVREYAGSLEPAVPLDVHTGIHTGLGIAGDVSGALLRESVLMGDPVGVADVLKDLAPAGEVFVGGEVERFTRDAFEYVAREPLALPGRSGTVPVFELQSRREQLHRTAPAARRHVSSALVGRDAELAALRARVAGLAAGRGGVVSLVAEAGLGKSRLVAELEQSEEAQQVRWLVGRSLSAGSRLAFHPFADLLRSWSRIGDEDDDETARKKLREAIAAWLPAEVDEALPFIARVLGVRLRAEDQERLDALAGDALEKLVRRSMTRLLCAGSERQPLVIVMDDLHWADGSSIELLSALLQVEPRPRLLVLAVTRAGFPETADRFRSTAHELLGADASEIALAPLDADASRALLANLFRPEDLPHATRRHIEEKARGNPFYIEEVVRALLDQGAVEVSDGRLRATARIRDAEIPGSIHEVVQARVDRLERPRRRLLQAASVIGQTFHVAVLQAVTHEEDLRADLEALLDAEFLLPSDRLPGEEYAFKHPLLQEVTYAGLLERRREELHRTVGRAIEEQLDDGIPGYHGMLAYHFSKGRDLARADEYLLRAGREAARAAASNEALHFFREASALYLAAHGDGGDPRRRAQLEQHVATALYFRGQFVESIAHYDRALELLGDRISGDDWRQWLRFAADLARVLLRLYSPLRRRRLPPASEGDREILALRYERAEATVYATPTRHVFDGMSTLAFFQRIDPASVPGSAKMIAGAAAFFAFGGISFDVSQRLSDEAHRLAGAASPGEQLYERAMSFTFHTLAGEWGAEHEIEPARVEASLARGELWAAVTYLGLLAERRVHQGDPAGVRACQRQIAQAWELFRYDLAKTNLLWLDTLVPLEEERYAEAREAADRYFGENPEDLLHILALGARARAELGLGELRAARRTLEEAAKIVARSSPVPPHHASSYARSRLLLDVCELEEALARGDALAARVARRRARASRRSALANAAKVAWCRPEILQLAARLARLSGRRRAAWRQLARCVAAAESMGAGRARARAFREAAEWLAADGRPDARFLGRDRLSCQAEAKPPSADVAHAELTPPVTNA